MKTLRLLVVSTSYPIRKNSVSGIFVKRLVESLSERSGVTVLTPADNEKIEFDKGAKVRLVTCRYAPTKLQVLAHKPGGIPSAILRNKWFTILVPSLLLSIMLGVLKNKKTHDVIFCNWAISGCIVGFLRFFLSAPIVTTLRGEDVKANPNWINKLILRRCLSYSDRLVLVSRDMYQLLCYQYPQYKHKYVVIHNGVDDVFAGMDGLDALKCDSGGLKCVTVASLIPRKNILHTLQALNLCHQNSIKIEFDIIGTGSELPKLKTFVNEVGLEEKVNFLGEMPPQDIAKRLRYSQIFITSSRHEGRPNAVLEAMASGLCILASDIDGHRELIEKESAGRLFPLEDMKTLANLLTELSQNRQKIFDYGMNAREYIRSHGLTWQKCSDQYESLFEEVVCSR